MYVVLTLLGIMPMLVAGQVVWLYVSDDGELRAQGERQATSYVELPAMRGSVMDREGRVLAINSTQYDLALDPTMEGFEAQANTFYERLGRLLDRSPAALRRDVEQRRSPQYVRLARSLTEEQRMEIDSWGVPGLILEPRYSRRYNYGTTAAHLLGHISSDGRGLAGIEQQYDEYLQGEPGRRAVKRDRRGVVSASVGGSIVEPKHGESLVLTVDLVRQAIMEEELANAVDETGARWGTAIAMEPNTGAILGMANVPTYDPNRPAAFSSRERRNYAIVDQMEPGSTFKLVGSAAALEQGAITLQDSIDTGEGWAVHHGYTLRDIRAFGTLSFAEVIANSSNVGMAQVARDLDRGTFYQYARNLGFGQPTWVDLPGEVGGTLKRPAEWSGTSLTSMSIGYEVDATPLQLLSAYAAVANGGVLVQPHVLAERRDMTGNTIWTAETDSVRRALEPETADSLRRVLELVVEDGSATRAQIAGLPIAGKTGTARRVIEGSYEDGGHRSSFVGFFPADDPEVALLVMLDEPTTHTYGGMVAAPVFQRIAERWAPTFPTVAERMAPPEEFSEELPDMPAVPTAAAVSVDAPADTLTTMPDVTGWSVRQAVHLFQQRGVEVQVQGNGRIAEQRPEAGADLPDVVTLTSSR